MTTAQRNRVTRDAHLQWVPIALMRVNPLSQRSIARGWVDAIVADFDPEQIGTPTVSKRGDGFYILDGQHRVEAMKAIGWGDQQVQCWVYQDLTEAEEAETFLKLNSVRAVSAFHKFTKSVAAGRERECEIERVARTNGVRITNEKVPGATKAVTTLGRIYDRSGSAVLGRTLRLVGNAYGDAGLDNAVLDGIALLLARYADAVDDNTLVHRLGSVRGGVNGLLNRAEVLRRQTGASRPHAVAAAAVEIINAGRGGKKLQTWWRDEA